MALERIPGPDWGFVDWHYGALHRMSGAHNRLLRVRAKGLEHLPREGGFLYAGNHTTYWDPILMQTSVGRPVNWLAKQEIMRNAFGRWFFGRGGCIPVDRTASRNPEAYSAALQALADGRVIGIFPEGGRNAGAAEPTVDDFLRGGGITLREPKSGVGRLALASGAPVVPVGILTDRFWPRGSRAPSFKTPIYFNVGEPVAYHGKADDAGAAREVAHDVMRRIAALLDEARAARDAGERWDGHERA